MKKKKKNKLQKNKEKKREDTLQWILNKNNKVEEFKSQKELINENQRKIAIEINRKKEYSQRFHQIFSKKNNNEKSKKSNSLYDTMNIQIIFH